MNAIPVLRGLVALAILVSISYPQTSEAAPPQVYAGSSCDSSFLVDGSGSLIAWGDNGYGNLAIGGYSDQLSPTAVPFPSSVHRWKTVAAANGFYGGWTLAVGDDSQLYGAGYISGTFFQYLTLVPPPAGVGGWSGVAASESGWLAVSTNGPIYGNINGRIWWPPLAGATRWTQVAVCSYIGINQLDLYALDDRGQLYGVYSGTAWFPNPGFTQIPLSPGATGWTNVSAGADFTLALANDGNLYAWGHNDSGQLGLGYRFVFTNTPQKVALPAGKSGWGAIAAGQWHTLATTSDGQLYAWGYNGSGQLGLGDTSPSRFSPTPVPNLTNVTAIAAGNSHSLAVADCQVLAWGRNYSGQLGAAFASPYYPVPLNPVLNYDICSTNPPSLPLVSITAPDPAASEGTWMSSLSHPVTNTGRFEISRSVATGTSLQVSFSVGGTASRGVDYFDIPSSVTIPANSNSASVLIVPTGDALAADPATVVINLLSAPTYQLGNSTNATVTLIQYESPPTFPLPWPTFQIFVGTNLNGKVFAIESSTNLTDWSFLANATNVWGVLTFIETNHLYFRQRFFRAYPLP